MKDPKHDEVFILEKVERGVWKLFCDPIYLAPEDKVMDTDLGDDVVVVRGKVIGLGHVPHNTDILVTGHGGAYIRASDLNKIL